MYYQLQTNYQLASLFLRVIIKLVLVFEFIGLCDALVICILKYRRSYILMGQNEGFSMEISILIEASTVNAAFIRSIALIV